MHAALAAAGAEVVEAPRNLFYGQRRMVVRAPEGTLVDVSSPCEPEADWMARVRQRSDGSHVED